MSKNSEPYNQYSAKYIWNGGRMLHKWAPIVKLIIYIFIHFNWEPYWESMDSHQTAPSQHFKWKQLNTSFNIANLQAIINLFGCSSLEAYLDVKTKGLIIKMLSVLTLVEKGERQWHLGNGVYLWCSSNFKVTRVQSTSKHNATEIF